MSTENNPCCHECQGYRDCDIYVISKWYLCFRWMCCYRPTFHSWSWRDLPWCLTWCLWPSLRGDWWGPYLRSSYTEAGPSWLIRPSPFVRWSTSACKSVYDWSRIVWYGTCKEIGSVKFLTSMSWKIFKDFSS